MGILKKAGLYINIKAVYDDSIFPSRDLTRLRHCMKSNVDYC